MNTIKQIRVAAFRRLWLFTTLLVSTLFLGCGGTSMNESAGTKKRQLEVTKVTKVNSSPTHLPQSQEAQESPHNSQKDNSDDHHSLSVISDGKSIRSNPFATENPWYNNPRWTENASKTFSGKFVAHHSTAVWLHRLADVFAVGEGDFPQYPWIEKSKSSDWTLRDHLQEAENQGNALLQLVLHQLPGRDCSAITALGEIPADAQGAQFYQTTVVDAVASILQDYPQVPVALILEPKSISALIAHGSEGPCQNVIGPHTFSYSQNIRYAINRFKALENVHIYLEAGNSQDLGNDDDLAIAAMAYHGLLTGFDHIEETLLEWFSTHMDKTMQSNDYSALLPLFVEPMSEDPLYNAPGYEPIAGFATNIGGYIPVYEPLLEASHQLGLPLSETDKQFYQNNRRYDEWTFSEDWLTALGSLGADISQLGVIIDTSRNGWRKMAPSMAASSNQVNSKRLDQRKSRTHWCNQPSGLGPRPQIGPPNKPWIDAYVWIKPPGESDGKGDESTFSYETLLSTISDPMCSNGISEHSEGITTGALPGSTAENTWFEQGFKSLLMNASPPLCSGRGDRCQELASRD